MLPHFKSVLLSITESCRVGCQHCGFAGSKRNREADADKIEDWIVQLSAYGIPKLIFTGGEPFERLDTLARCLRAAHQGGVDTAVFTSACWASKLDATHAALRHLSGLTHLYLSSDVFHQVRIPYQNVFNAIDAALNMGVPQITICITYADDNERLRVRQQYERYGASIKFCEQRVIPNPLWSRALPLDGAPLQSASPKDYRYDCEIGTPIINPNGDIFSCHVGKAAAHRDLRHFPYFLGNLQDAPFAQIMSAAALRPDYQYLRTHGARGVAELLSNYPELLSKIGRCRFTTECDMCFSVLKTVPGREALTKHVSRPDVRDEIDIRLVLCAGEWPLSDHGAPATTDNGNHMTNPPKP